MYRTEVRRQVDPALVEQIGPLQYRLRVFPIEPARVNQDSEAAAPAMHMWLTWRALRSAEGAWPLPRLVEKRNVFFDSSTARSGIEGSTADAWLPPSVPARSTTAPRARQVTFASGETVVVRPVPAGVSTAVPTNLRVAVVLDRSRSMASHAVEVRETLQRLRWVGADADVYLTTSTFRGEPATRVRLADLDLETLEFVSGQQASELLVQFDALRADTRYDVAVVVTDGTGFDLAAAPARLSTFAFPIWMLHVGGAFSLGYDDGTLAAIQASGGGVAGTLDELLARLRDPRGVDGYTWSMTPASDALPVAADDPFAAFAARHLILDHLQRQRGAASDIATLDSLHAIAKTHSIVTPYSSMIVLVNTEQQRRLAERERQGDRFDREGEGVGDTVPGALTNVTAVPEPHEWLLLGLGLLILGAWLKRTGRLQLPALPAGRMP
jgi:putative PEP-CTERM system integral membrane protein